MNAAFPVSWILILLLLLVVAGAMAAIIWRSWIAGSIVLLIVFLAFSLYWVRAVPSAPAMVAIQETSSTPGIEQTEPNPEFLKNANIYPSMEEAAKYLAERLCDDIQRSQPPFSTAKIHLVSAKKDAISELVKDVFNDQYPQANVVADDSHDGDASQLLVTLTISDPRSCLTLRAVQNGRALKQEACFKNAPWVVNLDQYKRDHANGEWIVGSSSMAEPSIEVAQQRAREDAALKLLPFVTGRFPDLNVPNVEPNVLRNRLLADFVRRKLIKEDFVQTLRMPVVGTEVYRASVLVDANSSQFEKFHSSIISETHHRTQSVRRFGGGVVGMGFVICLVYLFLNRATRGYFQMNLRLAAFLVLIAGVLVMMLIG